MPFTTFPLHALVRVDGSTRCACSDLTCTKAGKHPAWRFSQLAPGQQVPPRPGQGTALLTGVKSGVFVVDTDGPEADARFRAMGELPPTWTVATPSGGHHFYFRWPGWPVVTGANVLGDKIDVRGDVNGFVCTPGCDHKSGKPYVVASDAPIAEAPAWLLNDARLRGKTTASDDASENAPTPIDVNTEEGERRIAMARDLAATWPVCPGDGGASFFGLAVRLVRTLELPLDVAGGILRDVHNPVTVAAGTKAWTDAEISHKLLQARDESTQACGPLPEGLKEKIHELANVPQRAKPSKRREHNPDHRYAVEIGDVPNGNPRKASNGQVQQHLRNHPDWEGVLQYDAFADRVIAVDPPIAMAGAEKGTLTDSDITAVRSWFELVGQLLVGKDAAQEGVVAVAKTNTFHPVHEWLSSLPPGDPAFLDTAAAGCFGGKVSALDCTFLKRFLVGAVRRVLQPGTKLDTMLVLAGPQGAGKSTFVRALFGEAWTAEDIPDLSSKDAILATLGKWAVEVAELDKIIRTDPETAKSFLSRCVDTYRPPYDRNSVSRARDTVFIGTTNRDDILRDASGSRRFWIIEVESVDLAWVRANRASLFASALALVATGEPHWLSREEDEQRVGAAVEWEEHDPWREPIEDFLRGREQVTAREIYESLNLMRKDWDKRVANRVADTLRRLGCKRGLVGRTRSRVWIPPAHLAKDTGKAN